jgi:hypothetical protein
MSIVPLFGGNNDGERKNAKTMKSLLIGMGTVMTLLIGACVSLTLSVHGLQAEVSKLQSQMTVADGAAAAAIEKFERDFFARQEALARAQQYAAQQAAKNQAAEITADVMSLPTAGVHQPASAHLGAQITGNGH